MKKRIGVLGGSFDPVHLGHVALAKAALFELKLDKLIVIPANVQPFKQDWKVTPGENRLEMLRIAFQDIPDVEISSFELDHTDVSYTFDTLQAVCFDYPLDEYEISFVMGTDSFLSFETWYKGKTMLRTYSLAVSDRPGYKEEEFNEKMEHYISTYGTKVYPLESIMPDISSTEVRNAVKGISKDDSLDLIDSRVLEYIKEKMLYRD